MRNKFESTCCYCKSTVPVNGGDIWKSKGRWYACCDPCKASNPKQQAGAKKHKARQEKAKTSKKAATPAKAPQKVTDLRSELQKMTKKDLVELLTSLS